MKFDLSLGALVAPLLALPALAQAETLTGNAWEGQRLAERVCSACHHVEKGGIGSSAIGAPAFQVIADDPAVTETALLVFFRMPHEGMPDLILTPTETDDVIAYILSLR